MFSKKFTSIYERKTQNLAEKNKKVCKACGFIVCWCESVSGAEPSNKRELQK